MDDDKLMLATGRGDEVAFRRLVTRWEGAVFAFLYHMVGSTADAEDLSQEAFLRVYKQASRYRAEGRFKSWLFRIVGNLARSWLRRRAILRWVPFDTNAHDRPDLRANTQAGVEQAELQVAVRLALDRLPTRQREAIVLRRYQELSYQEIADALQTTVSAVESLLQRAAAALRRDLAGKVEMR